MPASDQTLSVTFTPTDSADYTPQPPPPINVLKATPTFTWANPAAITYGTAPGRRNSMPTSPVAGTFSTARRPDGALRRLGDQP